MATKKARSDAIKRILFDQSPEGRRRRGRPREIFKLSIPNEIADRDDCI